MQIRLSCYEHEVDSLVFNLRQLFNIHSVSKFYPNVRQTAIETVTEGCVYIKLNDFKGNKNLKQDFVEFLVKDMLTYFSNLQEIFGLDVTEDIDSLRAFYLSSDKFESQKQLLEFVNHWKISLLKRLKS
jgi:hypothetical protein